MLLELAVVMAELIMRSPQRPYLLLSEVIQGCKSLVVHNSYEKTIFFLILTRRKVETHDEFLSNGIIYCMR